MRNLVFVFLSFLLLGCEKEKLEIQSNLIDEFVYNPAGVVFKITNDVSEAYFQNLLISGNQTTYIYPFKEPIDSICIMRFHFDGSFNENCPEIIWFSKKGQYVCWRDEYIGSEGSHKRLCFGIPNHHKDLRPNKLILYEGDIITTSKSLLVDSFISRFPAAINDTVYVKLSKLRPEHFFSKK